MKIKKTMGGREVTFTTKLQYDSKQFPKIVDVSVAGGGCGPRGNWVDAFALAKEMIVLADESDALFEKHTAESGVARLAVIAKHEEKQKRGAAAQSLRARLKNAERARA